MATALDRKCSQIYAQTLHELGPEHGFGDTDKGKMVRVDGKRVRVVDVVQPGRAARYLAKYIAAIDGTKLTLSETVTHPDVPPQVTYVSRELTTRTGCTMRSLRKRREEYCYARQVVHDLGEGVVQWLIATANEPQGCGEDLARRSEPIHPMVVGSTRLQSTGIVDGSSSRTMTKDQTIVAGRTALRFRLPRGRDCIAVLVSGARSHVDVPALSR